MKAGAARWDLQGVDRAPGSGRRARQRRGGASWPLLVVTLAAWPGCSSDPAAPDAAPSDASARPPAADLAVLADLALPDAGLPDAALGPGIEGATAQWIEVDATTIYWVGTWSDALESPQLWSVPKAGGAPRLLVDLAKDGSLGRVQGLAQDDAALYFFGGETLREGAPITVHRLAKAGGEPVELARFTQLPLAIDLATDGADVFWLTDDGVVHRTPAGGGATTTAFTGALASLAGHQMVLDAPAHRLYLPTASGVVAVDTGSGVVTRVTSEPAGLQLAPAPGGMVFVGGSTNTLWRVAGTQATNLGIPAHAAPQGLACDGQALWWFHDGVGAVPPDGALSTAPLRLGGAESIVAGGLESIESYGNSVALDEAHLYFSATVISESAPAGAPRIFVVPR